MKQQSTSLPPPEKGKKTTRDVNEPPINIHGRMKKQQLSLQVEMPNLGSITGGIYIFSTSPTAHKGFNTSGGHRSKAGSKDVGTE